jgi:AraC-like DNA-binding protein
MVSAGSTIRPAENHWHLVFIKYTGDVQVVVVGALTSAGQITYPEGAEVLWIRFKLGTWLPHLSVRDCLNLETPLPLASSRSFWLKGSAWQLPTYDNAETFVDRLVREEILAQDEVVQAALQDQLPQISERTLRHHFLHTTGLTQNHIRQMHRAQQATTLLQQGVSILDTVVEAGYFDQPHLTKSLKQFIGYTPAQIIQLNATP